MAEDDHRTLELVRNYLTKDLTSTLLGKSSLIMNRIRSTGLGSILVGDGAGSTTSFPVGSNGHVLMSSSVDDLGLRYGIQNTRNEFRRLVGGNGIAESFPSDTSTTTYTVSDARAYFFPVNIPYDATITGCRYILETNGNYTADAENSISLYTSDDTTLTQVATTGNVGTIWQAGLGINSINFTSTYNASAGDLWVCYLCNSSATVTAPIVARTAPSAYLSTIGIQTNVKMHAHINSQTAAPATQAFSGLTANNILPYAQLF